MALDLDVAIGMIRLRCAARPRSMHVAISKFVMGQMAIQIRLQQIRDHKQSIARNAFISARCKPYDLGLACVNKIRLEMCRNQ